MVEETLYPHEVVINYWNKNIFRIVSTIFFIYTGMTLFVSICTSELFSIILTCIFFITGCVCNNYDYEERGV
jgi:uncharacterized membrane protein YqaE (UPF0057 family)